MRCLVVLKPLLFPCEFEGKGGSCIVQMEIQLQFAKQRTASGTRCPHIVCFLSCPCSGSSLPPSSLVLTELFCGVSTGSLWAAGAAAARDFWSSYCQWSGRCALARLKALHPSGPERATLLPAAAKALGSCLALAEIVVEFADSARCELNTHSQVVRPISTAVGCEKHARAFICNNRALLK